MSDSKPWEEFQPVTAPTTKPWEEFQAPVEQAVTGQPQVGYGEDIAKGTAGGFGRGVAGTFGLPGTVGGLIRTGLSKTGISDETLDRAANVASYVPGLRMFTGPDNTQFQKNIEAYTGKFYEPKTVPGQYASTVAEFAPAALIPGGGGITARAINTVVPALASETAGQATKDTAAEPYARAIAALGSGPAAAKLITPAPVASAARRAATNVFEREGIPLTAGQRTGYQPLQWLEANAADMPGSANKAAELAAQQADAYSRAVTSRLYDPAQLRARGIPTDVNLPDPTVTVAGKQSLSDEYQRLARANQLRSDPQLQNDLLAAQTKYESLALPSQKSKDVEAVRNSIVDTLVQGQGRMPGDIYQAKRSQLGTIAKGLQGDPYKSAAFRDMRTALDEAMERGLSPQDAAAWKLNNQRYANMKQLAPAVASAAGTDTLSPLKVAQSLRTGRPEQYATRAGNLDELAQSGALLMKPKPQSGTGPRQAWQQLFHLPSLLASGGGAGIGSLFGPAGAAVGAVAPFVVPRLALSKAGQAYLGNQAVPQSMRDIMAQTMTQQAISQPSGIDRNTLARQDDERKRRQARLQQGLSE